MNKHNKQEIINALRSLLCGDNLLTLASNDHLTSNNQQTEHIRTPTNVNRKVSLINNNIHKTMPTERTDKAWFSCLLQHPARKRSGSILTTP